MFSLLAYTSSLLLFKPPAAQASAYVVGSNPVDGSTIASVPHEVHIYFNAAISIISSAHVFVVQAGPPKSSLVEVGANTGVISGSNPNELIIPLKTPESLGQAQGLPQGSYLVRWAAVANDDGRTTFGTIGFNVGISSTGLSGTPLLGPSTSNELDEIRALDIGRVSKLLTIVWEWVMITALVLWIGTLVMEQFILSDGDRCTELHRHIKKRARSLQWLCLCALFFSALVSLALHTTDLVENAHTNKSYLSTLQSLLSNTNYGRFWLAQFALILIAMGLFSWANRSGAGQPQGYTPTRKGTPLHILETVQLALSRSGSIGRSIRLSPSLRPVLAYCNRILRTSPSRPTTSQDEGKSVHNIAQTIRPATTATRTRTGAVGAGKRTGASPAPTATLPYTYPVPTETSPSSAITIEKRHPIVWLLLSGLILLMLVLSRAPAQTFQPHVSALLFDWLNLAALSIWFGSFVYLGYLILPLFNHKELQYHTETLATILRRLIPFILAAIGIEIVSTLFLSEAAISQPQQLISDPYGRTLLLQIMLLVIMLTLSLYTLLRLHSTLKHQILLLPLVHADLPVRRLRQSGLQQTKKSLGVMSITITWLGVGILLCMALMTFFTPPIHFPAVTYSNQPTGPASTTNAQTGKIGDLSVSVQLLPGRSDEANAVILLINDSNGRPVTDAQVHLTTNMQVMDMGTQSVLIDGGNPVYLATFDKGTTFNMAGLWVITVEIQQPNQNVVQGTFQVMISS
jgi:putative copper export protein/methionine-rich copper-binding protein CopC